MKLKFTSRPGFAAAAAAGVLLLQLAAARLLLSADAGGVWFAGRRFDTVCFLRSRFGVPCPTCGMTRSIVLTLHGNWDLAMRINPGGPAWVSASLIASAALLVLAWRPGTEMRRWARLFVLVPGLAFALTLAGHWAGALLAR